MNKYRKGSALAVALVLSTVLLVLGLSYSKLTQQTNMPTQKIDEKIRLKYLADGLAQIAMLKFQKFPSEFYAAWEAANRKNNPNKEPLRSFCGDKAKEFIKPFDNETDQIVAFNSSDVVNDSKVINKDAGKDKIDISLTEYKLLNTDSSNKIIGKWNTGIITIKTLAKYSGANNKNITAESVITFQTTRSRL